MILLWKALEKDFIPVCARKNLEREDKLNKEKQEKIEEEVHNEECIKHKSSIPKELKRIFKTKSNLIINAYRKRVTEDSFGRKNYKKFLTEKVFRRRKQLVEFT